MRLLCLQSLYCNQSRGSLNEGTQKRVNSADSAFWSKKKGKGTSHFGMYGDTHFDHKISELSVCGEGAK